MWFHHEFTLSFHQAGGVKKSSRDSMVFSWLWVSRAVADSKQLATKMASAAKRTR